MKIVMTGVLMLIISVGAMAAQPEEYVVRNTRDLVTLCGETAAAPDYTAAIHFCHGYTLGAFAYYHSITANDPAAKFVCVKEPYPSRNQVIAEFVTWAKAHPQHMTAPATDTLFRFLSEKFPCK